MKDNSSRWFHLSLLLYCSSLLLGAFFSYSFTDPNLVISSNQLYWQWQQWLWHTWFDHPALQAETYAWILTGQWLTFCFFVWQCRRQSRDYWTGKRAVFIGLCVFGTVIFSYNALSHDVFNYMFNARTVLQYQANPHVKTALDFVGDPWLRFMHNTHTPAPYGYGWTVLSLLPYLLGGGKFLSTWLLFRAMAVASAIACGVVLWHWLEAAGHKKRRWLLLVLGCSPYLVSEVVVNSHNDLWMMLPALTSLYLLDRWRQQRGWWRVGVAGLLLLISISIKLATVVLLPLFFLILIRRWYRQHFKKLATFNVAELALVASMLMFIPLLTARSQYFHPWYLLWSMAWLPLIERKWWWAVLAGLAISSSYRYLPWIQAGGYEHPVVFHQQLVTWVGGLTLAGCFWLVQRWRARST